MKITQMSTRRVFYSCWAIILAISVHDWFLVIINRQSIGEDEENPVGRWLIAMNEGGVAYFLIAKLSGTIIAATVILMLYWKNQHLALLISLAVAMFQIVLLIYLMM